MNRRLRGRDFCGRCCIPRKSVYLCHDEILETYGAGAGIGSGAGSGPEGTGERYDSAYRDVQCGSVQQIRGVRDRDDCGDREGDGSGCDRAE